MIYYGRLQSPRPALSAKNVLNVPQHASGLFPPAALASGFSLDLVTNLVLLECLRQSEVKKLTLWTSLSVWISILSLEKQSGM
jgi:hypothetical protein